MYVDYKFIEGKKQTEVRSVTMKSQRRTMKLFYMTLVENYDKRDIDFNLIATLKIRL